MGYNNAQTLGFYHLPWYGWRFNSQYTFEIIITTQDLNSKIGLNIPNENTLGSTDWALKEKSWMADTWFTATTYPVGCAVNADPVWGNVNNRHLDRFYNYLGKDKIHLDHIYYTSQYRGDKTSIYFNFKL